MNGFWNEYDTDRNGTLEKAEFRRFLEDTYAEDEEKDGEQNGKDIIDTKFDNLFSDFDKDNNGKITREEMFDFLKQLFGLEGASIDYQKVMNRKTIKKIITKKEW